MFSERRHFSEHNITQHKIIVEIPSATDGSRHKCLKCLSQNMEYTPRLTVAEAALLLYKIMKQKMNNYTILRRNLVWI